MDSKPQQKKGNTFFSTLRLYDERITGLQLFKRWILILLVAFLFGFIESLFKENEILGFIFSLASLFLVFTFLAYVGQRLNDAGVPKGSSRILWYLGMFIPLINLIVLVILFFKPTVTIQSNPTQLPPTTPSSA